MKKRQRNTSQAGQPAAHAAETLHRYAAVVQALASDPHVVHETKKGFGSGALKVNSKIFAMLSSRAQFVVKLPKPRVTQLAAAGQGEPYNPGHGRIMKEWLAVAPEFEDWIALAREAQAYVSG